MNFDWKRTQTNTSRALFGELFIDFFFICQFTSIFVVVFFLLIWPKHLKFCGAITVADEKKQERQLKQTVQSSSLDQFWVSNSVGISLYKIKMEKSCTNSTKESGKENERKIYEEKSSFTKSCTCLQSNATWLGLNFNFYRLRLNQKKPASVNRIP